MDSGTYDQHTLSAEELGDSRFYIIENSSVMVTFYNSRPVAIDVDNFVLLRVTQTQPNIKGDTSGGGGKPATMETGLMVSVPFHVSEGDLLKIDTRTNAYIEKVR
jgi:elongation factor P